jgi:hypothetical protein
VTRQEIQLLSVKKRPSLAKNDITFLFKVKKSCGIKLSGISSTGLIQQILSPKRDNKKNLPVKITFN